MSIISIQDISKGYSYIGLSGVLETRNIKLGNVNIPHSIETWRPSEVTSEQQGPSPYMKKEIAKWWSSVTSALGETAEQRAAYIESVGTVVAGVRG